MIDLDKLDYIEGFNSPEILQTINNLIKNIDREKELLFNRKCSIKGKELVCGYIGVYHSANSVVIAIDLQEPMVKKLSLKIGEKCDVAIDMEKIIENNTYSEEDYKFKHKYKDFLFLLQKKTYNYMRLFFFHPVIKLLSTNFKTFVDKKAKEIVQAVCKEYSLKVTTNLESKKIPFIFQNYISSQEFLYYLMGLYDGVMLPLIDGSVKIQTRDTYLSTKKAKYEEKEITISSFDHYVEKESVISYFTEDFDINNPLKNVALKQENKKNPLIVKEKLFNITKDNKDPLAKHIKNHITKENLSMVKYLFSHVDMDIYSKVKIYKQEFFVMEKTLQSCHFINQSESYAFMYKIAYSLPTQSIKPYKINSMIYGIIKGKDDKKIPVIVKKDKGQFGNFPVYLCDDKEKNVFYPNSMQIISNESGGTMFPYRHNDQVIIGFIDGLPTAPVILGSLYSKKNPYPIEEDLNRHGIIVSNMGKKKAMSILIDPTDDKETMETIFIQNYNLISQDESYYEKCNVKDKKTKIEKYIKEAKIEKKYDKIDVSEEIKDLKYEQKTKDGNIKIQIEKGEVSFNIKEGDLEVKLDKGNLKIDVGKSDVFLDCGDVVNIKSKKSISLESEEIELKAKKKLSLESQSVEISAQKDTKIKSPSLEINAAKEFKLQSTKGQMQLAAKLEIKAAQMDLTGQFSLTGMAKIAGQVTIQGVTTMTGAVTVTGPLTGAAPITSPMFNGTATMAMKAIVASALG